MSQETSLGIKAPRQTKRQKFRSTAPPKSLGNTLNTLKNKNTNNNNINKARNEDDLLNFFSNDDNPFSNGNNKKANNDTNNSNDNNPFDFDFLSMDDNKAKDNEIKKLNPNLNLNKNFDKRSSHAIPDPNFDLSMWEDPFGTDNGTTNKSNNNSTNQIKTTFDNSNDNPFGNKQLGVVQETEQEIPSDNNNNDYNNDNNDDNNDDNDDDNDNNDDDDDNNNDNDDDNDNDNDDSKQNKKAINNGQNKKTNNDNNNNNNSKGNTNALDELHRGAALLKYPRRSGFPHFKHIQLSMDNTKIQWFSKRKPLNETCVLIKNIKEVVKGQETEVFKKFHQKTLEKSSFSVVYGHDYKTLDVAAKSIDECDMWVRCISKLVDLHRKKQDITKLKTMDVGIKFKDRNRPKSRQGAGNFVRANNSKNLKIDPVALKEIEKEMEQLHKTYHKVVQLCTKPAITKSAEYENIKYVLSELEERMEELTYEVANIRDTELAKREVWRANVDLTAIQEKVEVIIKHSSTNIIKRASSFF